MPVLDGDVDEAPTAVGPILAADEVRALMDIAENDAPTMPPAPTTAAGRAGPSAAAKPPMPPQPKSGLRARVRPEPQAAPEIVVDLGSLEPAIELEHIEADETHDIEVGNDPSTSTS